MTARDAFSLVCSSLLIVLPMYISNDDPLQFCLRAYSVSYDLVLRASPMIPPILHVDWVQSPRIRADM